MTGRRRRASTSSVESVDESHTRWRHESSVVRSVPADEPSDDWPIFELANAIVLGQDGKTIENALLVGAKGPFVVRGHLIIDDPSQKSHLIMRVRHSTPLEIRKSVMYSIGEAEDGRPLIWISGKGGWYEIDPCRAYKPMYNKMCEATTMYYTLLDIYTEGLHKKSRKGKNSSIMDELGTVFHKYAARVGDGSTLEEVIARANEHASFLIEKLSQTDAPIDWTTTAFYKWLRTEHVQLGKEPHNEVEMPRQRPDIATTELSLRVSTRDRYIKSSSVDVPDSSHNLGGRGKKSQTRSATPSMVDKRKALLNVQQAAPSAATQTVIPLYVRTDKDSLSKSPLQSAHAVLLDCFDALAPSKKGMTLSGTLTRIYFSYSFPNYRDGVVGSYKQPVKEWIHYYSKALLQVLEEKFKEHGIWEELQHMTNTELKLLSYKPSDFPVVLTLRRSLPKKVTDGPSTPSNQTYSTSDSPKPRGKRPIRTPGKSSLRPLNRATKKRPHSDLESHEPDPECADYAKKSRSFGSENFTAHDIDIDDVLNLLSEEDNNGEDHLTDPSAQDRYDLKPIKLVIRAEKIPDSSPRGPDDTWVCDQEGCDYIVRGVDQDESEERIRQHFRDHELQLTRVNLAMSEGARGHMPIHHLLEKIKQLSGNSTDAPPQPIRRKLIV